MSESATNGAGLTTVVEADDVFFSEMPGYLEVIARLLPLTYAVEGLQDIMLRGETLGDVTLEIGVLAGFAVALLTLAAVTVKRS